MKPDFQIIGGGLIGLSTAYALQEHGATVRIVEARKAVALETSFANAAMVHASLADPWNSPDVGRQMLVSLLGFSSLMKLRLWALPSLTGWGLKFLKYSRPDLHWQATKANYHLAEYSARQIRKWRDDLEIDYDYQSSGLLKIFRNPKAMDMAVDLNEKLAVLGLKAETISAQETVKKEPFLAPIADKLVGATFYPDDFKADAYRYCKALEQAIIARGGEILTNTKALSLIEENGKILGVRSVQADILAETTIIAAAAHSTKLLRSIKGNLTVRPVKGYSLTFDGIHGPKLPVTDHDLHCAISPLRIGMRIAGTAEITGFSPAMPKARLSPLLQMFKDVYPDLSESLTLKDGRAWHGFRPVSADGIPLIGKLKPGLAVNTGHGHMGWTLSAGSGALLADILFGQTPALDARTFAPNRS